MSLTIQQPNIKTDNVRPDSSVDGQVIPRISTSSPKPEVVAIPGPRPSSSGGNLRPEIVK